MSGTVLNAGLAPETANFRGCDGSGVYTALLDAPHVGTRPGVVANAAFEGGPWNVFYITCSKLEDWANGGAGKEIEIELDNSGSFFRPFAGVWMRTAPFSRFYVRDNRKSLFRSTITFNVFLTRAPGFNAGFLGGQGAWQ